MPPEPAPAPVFEAAVDPVVEPPVAAVRNSRMRERSRSLSERQSQPLSRAKSMESLPRGTGAQGGTSALRALFESKAMTPREVKRTGDPPQNFSLLNGDVQVKAETEETQDADEQGEEAMKNNITHDPTPLTSQGEQATPKVRVKCAL